MSGPVIAIDGPAGSGKTTLSRILAERLGIVHVDTGAIYRALTLAALREGIAPGDGAALEALAGVVKIELRAGRVMLGAEDVTVAIREREVTAMVSEVSAHPVVRERMVALQRHLAGDRGVVMEGRDIGTVVLPRADVKVFLTADPEERAMRRAGEMHDDPRGQHEKVLNELTERDRIDSERGSSPLSLAPGAVVVDSTGRGVEEIADEIERMVGERMK